MTKTQKDKAKKVAGEIIVEETNKFLDKGKSPVSKGAYKKMMADGKTVSDLLESGDMRAHISFEEHPKGVKTGIFDSAPELDRLKASGHNKGDSANHTKREFVPTPSKKYKKTIMDKVNGAIKEIKASKPMTAGDVKNGKNKN